MENLKTATIGKIQSKPLNYVTGTSFFITNTKYGSEVIFNLESPVQSYDIYVHKVYTFVNWALAIHFVYIKLPKLSGLKTSN